MASSETRTTVRQARKARGWRLIDLAARADMSPSHVSMIENGYVPALRSRLKLAAALEMAADVLWPGEPTS